ncbi:MAG: serine/threonine protein kinase, CMGC, CDC2/CDK sub [Sclerophora amabilis]|nr:MAG: serine/threonine protein kinase, CMGC, CDC2/CDK sub [Sclerophora amabilis]
MTAQPGSARSEPPSRRSLEVNAEGRHRFRGCANIRRYEILGKLGEGTFGEVHKARSAKNGSVVALKKILMHNEKDGFPITALREIKLLKMLSHVNILKLEEMAVERNRGEGRKKAVMYMVTPYMDHDLSGLLENPNVRFTEPQIKCYMLQLLEGLRYLHANHILHRDMKAANLLIDNHGILQIADFGLARHYDEPPPQAGRGNGEASRDYTTVVVTRWYRPPELLLQLRRYTPAIDMWGVGCVFGEMFTEKPILAGNSDLNQAQIIFDLVGSPNEENMPGWSSLPGCEGVKTFKPRPNAIAQRFREQGSCAISLLNELLKLDWRKRINAIDALDHPYFRNDPLPAKPGDLPKFEESHELDRRKFRGQKAALPPAPAGGTVGMGANGEWAANSTTRGGANWGNPHHDRRAGGWNGHAGGYGHSRPPQYDPRGSSRPSQGYRGTGGPPGLPGSAGSQQPLSKTGPPRDNGLPPRPTNTAWASDAGSDGSRDRGPPRAREPRLDSYVPSYGGANDGPRGRENAPRREDRYDRDRPTNDRREWGGRNDDRRRSRSPDKDRERERFRARERELYRR